jgi:hypothetical protein
MHIEQRGETQRLEALLRELRPIEARCVEFSEECLRAIERAQQRPEGQHKDDTP